MLRLIELALILLVAGFIIEVIVFIMTIRRVSSAKHRSRR